MPVDLQQHHLDWAGGIAKKMARSLPKALDLQDLQQVAWVEMWRCCERFDAQYGLELKQWACQQIKRAVLQWVRREWSWATESQELPCECGFCPRCRHREALLRHRRPTQVSDESTRPITAVLAALLRLPGPERALVVAWVMDVPVAVLAPRLHCSLSSAYAIRARAISSLRAEVDA